MNGRIVGESIRVCALLVIPAVLAWLTGRPFMFPSLGPSALALIVEGRRSNTARQVLGGHLVGVLGGLAAYHLLAAGTSIATEPSALSIDGLRLAGSAVLSIGLTTAGMLIGRVQHAPACATTLIVSLGLLPSVADGVTIMVAVTIMYGAYRAFGADGGGPRGLRTHR